MIRLLRRTALLPGLLALLLLGPGQARAGFAVRLDGPSGSIPVPWDGVSYDDSGNKEIFYHGTFEGFAINFVIATSNSPGTDDGAFLTVNSFTVNNVKSAPGTLTVTVTDTDFTLPGVLGSQMALFSSVGGTFAKSQAPLAGNSFTFQSYADPGNNEFGEVITPGPQHFDAAGSSTYSFGGSPDGDASFGYTRDTAAYSLTSVSTMTLNPGVSIQFGGNTSDFDPVPEPGALALLLTGLPGLGLAGWLRRRRGGPLTA